MYIHDAAKSACKIGYTQEVSDIRKTECPKCNNDYDQEFMVFHVRRHLSTDVEVKQIKPLFCPNCGRAF